MSKKRGDSQNNNKTKLIMKGNPTGYFKTDTRMNFKVPKSSIHYKKVLDNPLFPTFNCDRNYYTPAFYLPLIETMKPEDYQALHKHKVDESIKQYQVDQIMVPKPRSKHKYCGVCRTYYEEYLDHIQSKQHATSMENSKYQKIIAHQCKKFKLKFIDPQQPTSMEKNNSVETKINEDQNQNSTQSFIQHKKQTLKQPEVIALSL